MSQPPIKTGIAQRRHPRSRRWANAFPPFSLVESPLNTTLLNPGHGRAVGRV